MDVTELDRLEVDVCNLINELERLRSENAVLTSKLESSIADREALKLTNTKISLRIKQIIRQLKGQEDGK